MRAWVALRLQARRRKRAVPVPEVPAAPVITGGTYELGTTDPEWFDAVLDFTFVHGSFPVAQLEVWLSIAGGSYGLVTTLGSTATGYRHELVEQSEDLLQYKCVAPASVCDGHRTRGVVSVVNENNGDMDANG